MGIFSKQICIGMTWHDDGNCAGVLMTNNKGSWEVTKHWHAKAVDNNSDNIAALLEKGHQKLITDSTNTPIIVGPAELIPYVDTTMPILGSEETKQALAFEIPKHILLSDDNITSGYRILSQNTKEGNRLVRLSAIKTSRFEDWVQIISRIKGGVSQLIPALHATDPVASNNTIHFAKHADINFVVDHNNYRIPNDRNLSEQFDRDNNEWLLPDKAFNSDSLNKFSLSDEVIAETQPALILAAYGLTGSYRKDKNSWFPVPNTIRKKERQDMLVINLLFTAIIVILSAFYGYRTYEANSDTLQQYVDKKERLQNLRNSIPNFTLKPKPNDKSIAEQLEELEKEFNDAEPDTISFASALAKMSNKLDKKFYFYGSLRWTPGVIRTSIAATDDEESMPDTPVISKEFESMGLFKNDGLNIAKNLGRSITYSATLMLKSTDQSDDKTGGKNE